MSNWRIRLRRGNSGDAPPNQLLAAEPALEIDTGILWYGDGAGTPRRLRIRAGDIVGRGEPGGIAELDDRGDVPSNQLPFHINTSPPAAGENDQGTKNGDLWFVYET
jgi:hypothetical protein